jgi:hypothetical protein
MYMYILIYTYTNSRWIKIKEIKEVITTGEF